MLVGSDNGILLKEPQPEKIAEALKLMAGLSKQNLYELKSASIRKVQEQFTWQKSGAVLMDFLKSLPVNVPD
jgi:glycogen synthase